MDMQAGDVGSSNINALWIKNIYDNIKNLENMIRIAREGCSSLLDYLQIPYEQRKIILADVQFKNLKFIVTELHLLITDLIPLIGSEEANNYYKALSNVEGSMKDRKIFVKEIYSETKGLIIKSYVTSFFWTTLEFLDGIRRDIFIRLAPVLYVKEGAPN